MAESCQDHAAWVLQGPDLHPGPSGSINQSSMAQSQQEEVKRYPGLLPLSLRSVLSPGDSASLL